MAINFTSTLGNFRKANLRRPGPDHVTFVAGDYSDVKPSTDDSIYGDLPIPATPKRKGHIVPIKKTGHTVHLPSNPVTRLLYVYVYMCFLNQLS